MSACLKLNYFANGYNDVAATGKQKQHNVTLYPNFLYSIMLTAFNNEKVNNDPNPLIYVFFPSDSVFDARSRGC